MNNRHAISNKNWDLISPLLPKSGGKGRPGGDLRLFINAIIWIAKTGSPWRDLPEYFGKWNIIYQRFSYWSSKNYFEQIYLALQKPDLEEIMIDSTTVKCHQSCAGAEKKTILNLLASL